MTIKEIKRRIRELKKLKRDIPVKTENRRNINKQIRLLKNRLNETLNCDNPEKLELIRQINAIYPHVNDLRKFTVKQLQYHLTKIKEKR